MKSQAFTGGGELTLKRERSPCFAKLYFITSLVVTKIKPKLRAQSRAINILMIWNQKVSSSDFDVKWRMYF